MVAIGHDGGEAVEAAAQEDEDEPSMPLHLGEADVRQAERGDAAQAHLTNIARRIRLWIIGVICAF